MKAEEELTPLRHGDAATLGQTGRRHETRRTEV
jgi:hypothetical protein